MAHVTGTASMTAEELWRMPDDGLKHELVRGELRTTEPGGYEHGWLGSRILGDDETLDASDVVDGWLVRVGDLLG